MTLYHYKGICKNCKSGIGWIKGQGWRHITNTLCMKLEPQKGTVNK